MTRGGTRNSSFFGGESSRIAVTTLNSSQAARAKSAESLEAAGKERQRAFRLSATIAARFRPTPERAAPRNRSSGPTVVVVEQPVMTATP